MPTGQAAQVAFEVWPVALDLVPAGQSTGAPTAGQYEPAGHEPGTAVVVPTGQYTPAAQGTQLLRLPDCVHTLVAAFLVQTSVGVPA
jgi:hypothetical protein